MWLECSSERNGQESEFIKDPFPQDVYTVNETNNKGTNSIKIVHKCKGKHTVNNKQ